MIILIASHSPCPDCYNNVCSYGINIAHKYGYHAYLNLNNHRSFVVNSNKSINNTTLHAPRAHTHTHT